MPTCPKCKLSWGRSDEEHNLLFGVIALAFENWPHAHEFKPADAEHLRAWLAIEAEHFEALTVPADIAAKPHSIAAVGMFLCNGRRHFRMGTSNGKLVLLRPLTMRKGEIKVQEFRAMSARIFEIVESITGITPDQYKANQETKRVRVKQVEHHI